LDSRLGEVCGLSYLRIERPMSIVSAAFERSAGWCAASAEAWLKERGVHSPALVIDGETHVMLKVPGHSSVPAPGAVETRKLSPGVTLLINADSADEFMKRRGGCWMTAEKKSELATIVGDIRPVYARAAALRQRELHELVTICAMFATVDKWDEQSATLWCLARGWKCPEGGLAYAGGVYKYELRESDPAQASLIRDVYQYPGATPHRRVSLVVQARSEAMPACAPIETRGMGLKKMAAEKQARRRLAKKLTVPMGVEDEDRELPALDPRLSDPPGIPPHLLAAELARQLEEHCKTQERTRSASGLDEPFAVLSSNEFDSVTGIETRPRTSSRPCVSLRYAQTLGNGTVGPYGAALFRAYAQAASGQDPTPLPTHDELRQHFRQRFLAEGGDESATPWQVAQHFREKNATSARADNLAAPDWAGAEASAAVSALAE
jgi:hypothetical protein